MTAYKQSLSTTRYISCWTTSFFDSTVTNDKQRITAHILNCLQRRLSDESHLQVESSLVLRPTVSRPVCLGIKHPSGAYDQTFMTVRQLRVCWCGALSLTRGRVCRLQLLLVLASAVILWSESHGTRDHILLSQIRDFPFRGLLRLAGIRWRYSTPPPHTCEWITALIMISRRLEYMSPFQTVPLLFCVICWHGNLCFC
jgi:hypothetical protein